MSRRLFTCALCSADVWLDEPPAGVILCDRCRKPGISRRAFFFFAAAAVLAPTLPAPKKLYDLSRLTFEGVPLVVSPDVSPRFIVSTPRLHDWLWRDYLNLGGPEGDPLAVTPAASHRPTRA